MEVKVLDSALIVDFDLNTEIIRNKIRNKILDHIDMLILNDLSDWTLYFDFWYNNVEKILIYLKGKSMPQTRVKEIIVHIPIPVKSQVSWGVEQKNHIYDNPKHLNDKIKNFECLNVDFAKYTNMEDYVSDCMWRAVKHCFKNGFKINGIKLNIDMFS